MKYQNLHQNIINECIKGDQKAQFELYQLYYKAMFNSSLRILNDKMTAEDIMQEAFLSAFNNIKSYKGDVSFGAWLKKIVINKSIDELKRKKIDFIEIDDKAKSIAEEEIPEINYESQNIKINLIKDTINELPEGYRIVLSLYLLEGFDHEEIGQILNISNSTSRSQYTRAKKQLIDKIHEKSISNYEKN